MKAAKILTYTAIFEKSADGGYFAFVPMLQGCFTQGETFEETEKNIKEAIALYLDVLKEDGDEIPMETGEHIATTVRVPLPA